MNKINKHYDELRGVIYREMIDQVLSNIKEDVKSGVYPYISDIEYAYNDHGRDIIMIKFDNIEHNSVIYCLEFDPLAMGIKEESIETLRDSYFLDKKNITRCQLLKYLNIFSVIWSSYNLISSLRFVLLLI